MEAIVKMRRALDGVSYWGTVVGAYVLLAASLLVCVDVVMRKATTWSLTGADELSGYALALATSWGAAYALFRGSHIRVDVVYRVLPLGVRAWLDVAAIASMLVLGLLLAWHAGDLLLEAILYSSVANTPLRTPLWIPQSLWWFGFVLLSVSALVTLAEAMARAVAGQHGQVVALAEGALETTL